MNKTVADVLLNRLREWGVTQVFGYPGDGINGLLAAWGRADNDPEFVQARHEEMAAFEAVGYAKFSGAVGVCTATSGPGAIHLLTAYTTPSWITFRSSRSSGRPSAPLWVGHTSRKSIFYHCTRMCAATTCKCAWSRSSYRT